MADISKLVAALMESENRDRAMRLSLTGDGGYDNSRGSRLLSGGGRATLDIPLTDRFNVSPYFGGGGAVGTVAMPQGDLKIKEFAPEYGLNLKYKFD